MPARWCPDSIDPDLRDRIEDVVLNRRGRHRTAAGDRRTVQQADRPTICRRRMAESSCPETDYARLVKGIDAHVDDDTEELRAEIAAAGGRPIEVIEGR